MDVENDTNEDVEYTNPALECEKLPKKSSKPLNSKGNVIFHSKDSGCGGDELAKAFVDTGESVRLFKDGDKFKTEVLTRASGSPTRSASS